MPDYSKMLLLELVGVIRNDWKKPYFGAVPYIQAMGTLETIDQNYFADTGRSVVAYFLANAGTWKGEVARNVKAELKKRLNA